MYLKSYASEFITNKLEIHGLRQENIIVKIFTIIFFDVLL